MKKIFFLMLTFLIGSAASMNAQVLIGLGDEPDPSAVLELKSANLGFLLPRVALQSTEDKSTIANPVVGLTVYNTATIGSGATAVVPGVYYYSGSWILISGTAPVITTQPKSFSWSRLYEENGDPNGPITATVADLEVVASGVGLTYQWYKKAVNKNAADILLTSETNPTYKPVVTAWGMNSYYCVVSNAYGSVKSDLAEIAIGCGAKTSDNTWLKFMCHNLGASPVGTNQSLDEITFATDTSSIDAKGWLFQWGRVADGYQWRGSTTKQGPVALTDDASIPAGNDAYGKFVTISTTPYDWRTPQRNYLWRNWDDGRFPCPSGWRIPSSSEWGSIYRDGGSYGTPGAATANTWYWENRGYGIRPDGSTTTLFLPVAGARINTGAFLDVGTYGHYWSSTSGSADAFALSFRSSRVSPSRVRKKKLTFFKY